MALTPEEVVNQKFTITKFRDGYDLDQVDDFLDTIVEELREHEREKAELREQLEAANAEIAQLKAQLESGGQGDAAEEHVSERTIVVDAPPAQDSPLERTQGAGPDADAIKSSAMLQLALELHDKHVHEGESKRDQLVKEAEQKASELVSGAEQRRDDVLKQLERESGELRGSIKELREFETEYRTTLRSYIQSQLRNLDGSPEPDGAPAGLD